MTRFLNTRGRATLGIGICDRCSRKFPLEELRRDPNSPGLRVCREDLDELDRYRLPPRAPDQVVLPFTRPDVSVAVDVATAVAEATDIVTTGP
jgi:hypothetical protein